MCPQTIFLVRAKRPRLFEVRHTRGWRNEDPEPRVGGGGVQPKAEKKNCDLTDFDGGSGR